MPNFVKISRQIKELAIQVLDYDCSVCMAAIRYSGAISAVPTKEQLLDEKSTRAKFQINNLKADGIVRVYIYRQTGRQTEMAKSTSLDTLIIYI